MRPDAMQGLHQSTRGCQSSVKAGQVQDDTSESCADKAGTKETPDSVMTMQEEEDWMTVNTDFSKDQTPNQNHFYESFKTH